MKKCFQVLVFFSFLTSPLLAHPVTVDGNPSDWTGTLPGVDQFIISSGEAIWHDALNDDNGDGGDAPHATDNPSGYSYPDTSLYNGTEADIVEWRFTPDIENNRLYFLVRLAGFELTWQPIVAILIDVDHIQGSGQEWAPQNADIKVPPEHLWEYAITLRDGGVLVQDKNWNDITGLSEAVFNPDSGIIEAGIDITEWNLEDTLYFAVISGLGDFGHFREVDSSSSTWFGGGGIGIAGQDTGRFWVDPDVYDICFVPASQQAENLNNYSDGTIDTFAIFPDVLKPESFEMVSLSSLGVNETNSETRIHSKIWLSVKNNTLFINNSNEESTYIIYNCSGREVLKGRGNKINISKLGSGVFYVIIDSRKVLSFVRVK